MKPEGTTYALVADDDEDWRHLIAAALRRANLEVLEAEDGEELVAEFLALQARGETPAVVVSDVQMPGRGGLEVTAALRGACEELPIVLVTGLRDPALPSIAESAGASCVLTKPITPANLGRRVQALIDAPTPGALTGSRSAGSRTPPTPA